MDIINTVKKLFIKASCSALIALFSTTAAADFTDDIKTALAYEEKKYGSDMKIRGWAVAKNIYMGQAKIAGQYGFGLVVESKLGSWGINNRGIGFLKKF